MNFINRLPLGFVLMALSLGVLRVDAAEPAGDAATAPAAADQDSAANQGAAAAPPLVDPTILLLRDDAVRTALALSDEQRRDLDALLRPHNRMLLAIRDVGPAAADESARPAIAEIRAALKTLLTEPQRVRLQGLILQAQGYDALLRKDVAAQLQLPPATLTALAEISADFRDEARALQQPADPPRSPEAVQTDLKNLQANRHRRVLAQLDAQQQQRYGKLLGEPFDFTKVRPSPADMPELTDATAWLNSPPLDIESLRGQVVVVHFFAFGCINCIHNYPWYREWHEAYAGQPLTIIGIHTPETAAEADAEQLKASLAKHELTFPVAVDNDKKLWHAWYNGIWPSVYLVDKQGRVRYWWYGELDWQGAGNQRAARQQINQLLAE